MGHSPTRNQLNSDGSYAGQWWTIAALERSGFASRGKVYDLIRRGRIAASKVDKTTLVNGATVDAYLDDNRIQPKDAA